MGTQGLSSPRLAAFNSDVFPRGLDLGRCVIAQDVGVFRANDTTSFEAGMLVGLDTTGLIIKCVSKPVLGVAKWNKATSFTAAVIDEPISFATATGTATLKHANVTRVYVRSAADLGGAPYALTTDYTLSAVNGVLTHVAAGNGGSIPLATTVYVRYLYTLTTNDLDFEGRNFFNFLDDVSVSDNRITVINGPSTIFTTQYDPSRVFTLTSTGSNLYCGGNTSALSGLFTNDSGEGEFVGTVLQLPTANDPFLGVRLGGGPVAQ